MHAAAPGSTPTERLRVRLSGAVQGVGMRPFAHRLATECGLTGFVRNGADGVMIEIEGVRTADFLTRLGSEAPPLARIDRIAVECLPQQGDRAFTISPSTTGRATTTIVPDAATCSACLTELFDPASRFHLYPFINCTHCGPRYTITRHLPYDRPQTSMARFAMCLACSADYTDPTNRRFHAEPIACPICGPRLSHPIAEIAAVIGAGGIIALKGIGGFHLICDATNEAAVADLRGRKSRDAKPLAVMLANPASIAAFADATTAEAALASTPARPIVLMRARPNLLAPLVAPNLSRIGVMLAGAPVHHLLFAACGARAGPSGAAPTQIMASSAAMVMAGHDTTGQHGVPGYDPHAPNPIALIATSANPHGEPLVVDDADARRRLSGMADLIVTHDRAIVVRADDSVMQLVAGAPAFLRRARGFVPDPIPLHDDGPTTLALGAHLKSTITVTRGREAFVSQHIGDLDTAQTIGFFHETVAHLLQLLDVTPERVAADLHPDYRSSQIADTFNAPVVSVQHHAAHIAAIAAEHGLHGPVLGLALDGHGLGTDGGAWGGELLLMHGPGWRRIGHLEPLPFPGGDRAAREPWRMGVAALHSVGRGNTAAARFPVQRLAGALAGRLHTVAFATSSLGRLFDAVAALLGVREIQDYEGQAAMELEALADTHQPMPHGYILDSHCLSFAPLLTAFADRPPDPATGAALFHGTLIAGLTDLAAHAAVLTGLSTICLGGGCLMNRVLAEGLAASLPAAGLTPMFARKLPCNDGGLSFGQAVMARQMPVPEE